MPHSISRDVAMVTYNIKQKYIYIYMNINIYHFQGLFLNVSGRDGHTQCFCSISLIITNSQARLEVHLFLTNPK